MSKASMRWKNWCDFVGSTFDTIARRKLVEDRDTILGKIQELQNEIDCTIDSRDLRCWISTQWTIPRYQSTCVFPPHPEPGGMLCRSLGMSSRKNGPPSFWDTWYNGKRFLQIQMRHLQHFTCRSWFHGSLICQNTHHHMRWVTTKHQFRNKDASQTVIQNFSPP